MKKVLFLLLALPLVGFGQKKSGVVYSEHPAYDVVTESYRVWETGYRRRSSEHLYAEDAKIWGPGDDEPGNIDDEVGGMLWWQENFEISSLLIWILPVRTLFSTKAIREHGRWIG